LIPQRAPGMPATRLPPDIDEACDTSQTLGRVERGNPDGSRLWPQGGKIGDLGGPIMLSETLGREDCFLFVLEDSDRSQ
jgi:hypothetical protein